MPGPHQESESTIECVHCGERFYFELNRCPNCGRSVFPEEEDDEAMQEPGGWSIGSDLFEVLARSLTAVVAVMLGLLLSFAAGSLLFFGLRGVFGPDSFQGLWRPLLLTSVPAGAFAGGFLAAALEKNHPRSQGLWVGGLSILVAVTTTAFERDLSLEPFFSWETLPWWAATVLAGYAGGEVWRRQQRNTVLRELFPALPGENELYERLLAMIGHDPARAERLIDFEKQYMPNANRRTLIESAIQRLERDNR
jgi:hypothetical protein